MERRRTKSKAPHRDPDEVRISIFPDRVEVRNPGTLMEGGTLRTIKTAKVSRRRNPLIADLLRRIQYVEACGCGIALILDKAPNVRFSQVAGIFITEFPRAMATGNTGAQSRPETSKVTPEVASLLKAIELKARVVSARITAARAITHEAIPLYWDIGGSLVEKQKQHAWGESVITQVSTDLLHAFPGSTGYLPRM